MSTISCPSQLSFALHLMGALQSSSTACPDAGRWKQMLLRELKMDFLAVGLCLMSVMMVPGSRPHEHKSDTEAKPPTTTPSVYVICHNDAASSPSQP